MSYLCLVSLDEKRPGELADQDGVACDEATRGSGHCIASQAPAALAVFGYGRPGAGRGDRRPQGCGRRAYRDVFTACPRGPYRAGRPGDAVDRSRMPAAVAAAASARAGEDA